MHFIIENPLKNVHTMKTFEFWKCLMMQISSKSQIDKIEDESLPETMIKLDNGDYSVSLFAYLLELITFIDKNYTFGDNVAKYIGNFVPFILILTPWSIFIAIKDYFQPHLIILLIVYNFLISYFIYSYGEVVVFFTFLVFQDILRQNKAFELLHHSIISYKVKNVFMDYFFKKYDDSNYESFSIKSIINKESIDDNPTSTYVCKTLNQKMDQEIALGYGNEEDKLPSIDLNNDNNVMV